MTTENGLETLKYARRDIEVLRERLEWLQGRVETYEAEGHAAKGGWDRREILALEWAIPVLEAEWDNLARMQRCYAVTAPRTPKQEISV